MSGFTRRLQSVGNSQDGDDGGVQPAIFQDFVPPWSGNLSPNGNWRIAGVWTGTGNNTLDPANASIVDTYSGESGGFLTLTSRANSMNGAEIQTLDGTLGYGYYETRMKVTNVPGECVSFFWKEVNYGAGEIDIEFLPIEWDDAQEQGTVHYTIHPGWDTYGTVKVQNLAFNPSHGFHRYGFLWTPTKLIYTVDGQAVQTYTNPPAANLVNTNGGYIMMNSWTSEDSSWGGGPPATDATSAYDWVKFYPGATQIPT